MNRQLDGPVKTGGRCYLVVCDGFAQAGFVILMEGRGSLHGRHHHTTLQDEAYIAETGPHLEVRMPPQETFDPPADDPEARLLPRDDTSNAIPADNEAGRFGEEDCLDDSSTFTTSVLVRSWIDTGRSRKRFAGLPALDTLDVLRESSRILRRHSNVFTTFAEIFVVPASVIVLTHVFITRPAIEWLQTHLEVAVFDESVAAAIQTPYTNLVYLKLAEFLVTSFLCIPIAITLAALAKVGVVYTVASTYVGLKVSFLEVMHRVVPRVWLPLIITYACSCSIFLASGVVGVLLLGISNGLFVALHPSSAFIILVATLLGLIFSGIFIYLKIILNVANVICVLENIYGFAALARSFSIIQGRVQVALWSYLVTYFCGGFITLLFEYRVTDKNDYTEHNSGAWEGLLLVIMHSFVYLFDDIMSTVFYFTCPTSSSLEDFHKLRNPEVGTDMTSL